MNDKSEFDIMLAEARSKGFQEGVEFLSSTLIEELKRLIKICELAPRLSDTSMMKVGSLAKNLIDKENHNA